VDPEFADLVPLFAEEAHDRLERLATCLPRLESDPQAAVEAKRELHTIKGAGRMFKAEQWDETGPKFDTADPAIKEDPQT